jgi:hypothetical protein
MGTGSARSAFSQEKSKKRGIAMKSMVRVSIAVALTLAAASPASGQSSAPSTKPDQNAPSQFDAESTQPQQRNENLSERLDRSDGVIHPPDSVDPEMRVAPPPTGDKMPVVPAPGSSGGDPTIKPK